MSPVREGVGPWGWWGGRQWERREGHGVRAWLDRSPFFLFVFAAAGFPFHFCACRGRQSPIHCQNRPIHRHRWHVL